MVRTAARPDPGFALEYVGIGAQLDELHLSIRSRADSDLTITRVELDGARVDATIDPSYSGVTHAQVGLESPWRCGSFHAVAMGNETGLQASLIRALPTPPPLGIMRRAQHRSDQQTRHGAQHRHHPAGASRRVGAGPRHLARRCRRKVSVKHAGTGSLAPMPH